MVAMLAGPENVLLNEKYRRLLLPDCLTMKICGLGVRTGRAEKFWLLQVCRLESMKMEKKRSEVKEWNLKFLPLLSRKFQS
jgi:hypothetical protein